MLNLENFATKVNNQAILWKPGHVCEHLGIRKNLIENEPPKWQGQSNPWVMRWRGVQMVEGLLPSPDIMLMGEQEEAIRNVIFEQWTCWTKNEKNNFTNEGGVEEASRLCQVHLFLLLTQCGNIVAFCHEIWVGVTNHHMGCCYFIPFLSQVKWNKLAWHGGCGKSQNQPLAAWWHQTWLLFQMVILVS